MNSYLPLLRRLTERLPDGPYKDTSLGELSKLDLVKEPVEGLELSLGGRKIEVDITTASVFHRNGDEWMIMYDGRVLSEVYEEGATGNCAMVGIIFPLERRGGS